jgi:O-antigen/teichoic acid export membrane protein
MTIATKINDLKNRQGFMRYFKNTSWLMGEKILRMIVGLFVGIWVARYLGPEQFGLLSYAQAFVALFTVIASFGLDGILVRELVKDSTKRDALMGTVFRLKLVGALLTLSFLAVAVNLMGQDEQTSLLMFAIASATVFQSFNVIDFYFQANVLSRYVVFANVISLLFSSILKIALILNNAPLLYFGYVILFDSVVLSAGLLYFYINKGFFINHWLFDKQLALRLLKDSWPLILSGAFLMVQARLDQVMIKEMVSSEEVGHYSVALRLVEVFGFVPMLLKNSLFPAIQSAKNISNELYQNRLLNFYRLNFVLFLVTAIPIFMFAEKIVTLLFGVEYKAAGVLLALMSSRLFFANMGVARGAFIMSENMMKFSLITMMLGTATNVTLNYIWIAEYGAKGAIMATIISFFVTIFAVDWFYYKTRKNVKLQLLGVLTFFKLLRWKNNVS